MTDNNVKVINPYQEDIIEIHAETFDKDFDDVGYEPEVIDDSDEDLANEFGY